MFYDDDPEALPWDYFLTNYERDLLTLPIEEVVKKYNNIPKDEIIADLNELKLTT